MSDKSDRVAVNREYRGSETGNQAENVTGKPVKAPEKPSNLSGQVRHIEIDGSKWATDKGGLSTAFGRCGQTQDPHPASTKAKPWTANEQTAVAVDNAKSGL